MKLSYYVTRIAFPTDMGAGSVLGSVLFRVVFFAWTAVAALGIVFGRTDRPEFVQGRIRAWAVVSLRLLRLFCRIDYCVHGSCSAGPGLFASKHQSAADILIALAALPNPVIVAKSELTRIPIFGRCIELGGHIPVTRRPSPKALGTLLSRAEAAFSAGRPVLIFPEGTRTAPGKAGRYNAGAYALSSSFDCSVTPIALNSGLFWAKGVLRMRSGVIEFEILPELKPSGGREEFTEVLKSTIEAATRRLEGRTLQQRRLQAANR